MLPHPTARLRFREMTPADVEAMSSMLGDPAVMTYYPAPKSREESEQWIAWNQANYARDGFGLWIVETLDGGFVGDCGLTWQSVNGRPELEVGYHVRLELQGRGYATEAALACLEFARDVVGAAWLVAIIHPDNAASLRVAERLGMRHLQDDLGGSMMRTVMGVELS
ncbi:GNAT family N-acetyltransferase [Arthrobacter sp. MYb23]|uniref:GNAT family N-acetyltransferase n=1 Tax=unclassified Arthrobacter TaxID=235627 RepID=UPI000CFE2D29|nr:MULTISPECIES: GNAT family N-acetyltransferase [unclassified Arthrobacter]PRB42600.1 GNAT family N-acetyltransferase [Arthrobacter sp. MYb51]PRB89172.1 GNAT family N-acetyltransferase [Arthrobacter sp. MYb23]